ncbi:MAG TPA: HslU--HslV peptidase proteolytic subunit [Balneola sp.]|jgi:ATP-dependent HslUV protease subunit HslV|nr:HslU--HslV peptidase proteolytic subunit [Bacteroidota bacterium]MAC04626.1 HslU--HslV peptidase proteolytic subunit [Balneola sp.]MAO76302.1 HslU--HslV peptidase proteolytic subunit [Balneola sp.]MBF65493.1 HslU--HslV peptidase proteolytic subunit [Balneola sp.]HBZ39244.1 HslU--HslV peptidase proteolytic subunit [Balneola sp.]|tara:strand:- start:10817 stop:11365 length:549 start_codon:yes stop_codon:yes gene_type:complete
MSAFKLHATTVVGVIHNGKAALGSDGQATMDKTVMKSTVKKVRKLYGGKVLAGFAGSTADAFTLFEKYEEKLNEYNGNMQRAAVELAKEWRKDKFLQKLEALLIVMNNENALVISGQGDVIEPDDNIATIGSGGSYALSAARAMSKHAKELTAKQIVEESLNIAADIDIYTNHNLSIIEIED